MLVAPPDNAISGTFTGTFIRISKSVSLSTSPFQWRMLVYSHLVSQLATVPLKLAMRVFLHALPPTLCLIVLAPYCSGYHSLQVTWIRPVGGDIYSPGSSLVGQWTTNDHIISPSFKLCNAIGADFETTQTLTRTDSECGTPVYPVVRTKENGTYMVTVCVLSSILYYRFSHPK